MSLRTIIIGILALTFGGSAAVGVNILYRQRDDSPSSDTIPIVIAKADIPRGVKVSAEQIKTRNLPKDQAPEGALHRVEDVVDRVAFTSFVKEEPLLDRKLSPKSSKGGLAALVPKGMRGFTIYSANVASNVAGFILPGNKVDVLLTLAGQGPNDRTGGGSTSTLLQNVEILAVDQRLDAPPENRVDSRNLQSVTLLVTPDQAAKLDLGQNRGTLHLALRNPADADAARTQPATMSGLLFHQEKPWSEQLASVLETWNKLTKPVVPPEPPKPTPEHPPETPEAPPPVLIIRTLRGNQPGTVYLELQGPPQSGR